MYEKYFHFIAIGLNKIIKQGVGGRQADHCRKEEEHDMKGRWDHRTEERHTYSN